MFFRGERALATRFYGPAGISVFLGPFYDYPYHNLTLLYFISHYRSPLFSSLALLPLA